MEDEDYLPSMYFDRWYHGEDEPEVSDYDEFEDFYEDSDSDDDDKGCKGWISTEVVRTIALHLPKIKKVCIPASRIRLFYGKAPRQIWPDKECWKRGMKREIVHSLDLKFTEEEMSKSLEKSQVDPKEHLGQSPCEVYGDYTAVQVLNYLKLIHSKSKLGFSEVSGKRNPLLFHEYYCGAWGSSNFITHWRNIWTISGIVMPGANPNNNVADHHPMNLPNLGHLDEDNSNSDSDY